MTMGPLAGLAMLLTVLSVNAAPGPDGARRRVPDSMAERVLACVACHGEEGRATAEGYFPRIAGKPAGYLYNQLVNFRDGKRVNPMMTYLVDNLPDAYLREIAQHFAARNLPACAACHGDALTGVAPAVPGLLGLPRDYLVAQLGAWRNKSRRAAAPDCMSEVVSRLTDDDIAAATSWLASQPVPAVSVPAARAPQKAPLDCGGLR